MEKVMDVHVQWIEQESELFQGTAAEMEKRKEEGQFDRFIGSHGSWQLIKNAKAIAFFKLGDESISINIKAQIRKYYGKQKCTEKMVQKVNEEFAAGNICLTFDESGECMIEDC